MGEPTRIRMTFAEIISLPSLSIFSLSLSLSFWTFFQQRRMSGRAQATRLHEVWWSDDMVAVRDRVYSLCRDQAHGGPAAAALVSYYVRPLEEPEPPGRAAFAKLVGFFDNLEACISSGLVDERLAWRLFCEAHYLDYQPLVAAVRDAICSHRGCKLPPWLEMTRELEARFSRQGTKFLPSSNSAVTGK